MLIEHFTQQQQNILWTVHGNVFIKIDHILSRKQISTYKFKRIQITQSMFSNHCGIKLESNSKLAIGLTTWMKLKCIMLSERSKAQKTMCCMVPLLWHSGTTGTKIWPVFARDSPWVKRLITKEPVGIGGGGLMKLFNIFISFISCGCYKIVFICQNSQNCTLKSMNLLYVNYTLIFKMKGSQQHSYTQIEDTVNEKPHVQ